MSQTGDTPLPELYRKASEELGYKTLDKNGEDQIGIKQYILISKMCSESYEVVNKPNTKTTKDVQQCQILKIIKKLHKTIKFPSRDTQIN